LNLTAQDSYLLSQIDGTLDERELAVVTGMTPERVAATLDRLASLGAIELTEEGAPKQAPPTPPAPRPSRPVASAPAPPSGEASDDRVDLEPARRARVDDLWRRLSELTHYELLGVAVDADKKQIKSAYYQLAPEFHPDKYFRKQLGPYRQRIEAIFARITLAHDVLTTQKPREEYDAYLEQTRQNRSMSAVLEERQPADVDAILAAVERAAAEAFAAQQQKTQTPPPPPSIPAPSPTTPPQAPPSSLSPQEVLRQRREALARKLIGGARLPQPSSRPPAPTPPARPDPAAMARGAEALRARQEAAMAEAKRAQVAKYLETGRAALDKQDYAGAANAYRIAAALEPDDVAVQTTCNQALREVAAALAEGYWKQGLYEEGQERFAEAALSFSKVCAGRPDSAVAHDKVALMTLKSSTNHRRAVEFARKAIELDPKKPEYRITLARAYAAAGLEKSASSELDRALEVAPKDPRVVGLVNAARAAIAIGGTPPPAPASAQGPPPSTPFGAAPPESGPAATTRKGSGIHALVSAVRSALAPKESK
jgi:curved DNA-binding protein CbpA